MSRRKNMIILIGLVLAVSLLSASASAALMAEYYSRTHFEALGEICQEIITEHPEAEQTVLAAVKNSAGVRDPGTENSLCTLGSGQSEYLAEGAGSGENILCIYGYQPSDFVMSAGRCIRNLAVMGFLIGGGVFLTILFLWRRKVSVHIRSLTRNLEMINTGNARLLFQAGDDDFSGLQDEIYKTVTKLYQTRDAALAARNNFADNLYNIAHQIKTPITSISLSLQMMQNISTSRYTDQIQRQLSRLKSLQEALLLLSRIDSGTLLLEKKEVDVFTLLVLAADNLQEIAKEADVAVHIPEAGETVIRADLEWTMEAVMNLLKNCIEHTPPGGSVHCSYTQNPLYTQILITDTGGGFAKEDIPRLFERFYRGKNAKKEGIGIGLSLSRAIIESQNGTLGAGNLANGGACFDVRFYIS